MRRLYTREWQGIPFSSFAKTSTSHLADADFYNSFYRAFFDRYKNYEEMDPEWRRTKDELSQWVVNRLPAGGKVLSVGCGLGYMEQGIFQKYGHAIEIHVQDYAGEAHRWLQRVLPVDRIHQANSQFGDIGQYDLILLSAVDYALPDKELDELLTRLGPALILPTFSGRSKKGILTLIGARHEQSAQAVPEKALQTVQPCIQAGSDPLG